MTVEPVYLDPADAIELGELLEFLGDWLLSERESLAAPLSRFIESAAFGIDDLRADVSRSAFLLGAGNGQLFGEEGR